MHSKLRIGIGVDDVLADFVSAFRKICNRKYGTPLDLQPVDWAWSNFHLSHAKIDEVWKEIRETPLFWYTLNQHPSATKEGFAKLGDAKLFFVTSRFDTAPLYKGNPLSGSAEEQTAAFLKYHFGIRFPVAIVGTPKGLTAKALGLTHFIDDRDVNCVDVKHQNPDCQVFVKDTSHNQNFQNEMLGIQRVGSFDEFAAIIGGE